MGWSSVNPGFIPGKATFFKVVGILTSSGLLIYSLEEKQLTSKNKRSTLYLIQNIIALWLIGGDNK